jgi:hypothetical protein
LSDLRFRALQRSPQVVHCGLTSSSITAELHADTPGLGEITALPLSWRPHLEASDLSRVRTAPNTDGGAPGQVPGRLGNTHGADWGIPTAAPDIRREHVFVVAELEWPLLRVRRDALPLASASL